MGFLSAFAGSTTAGATGDNGPATAALLFGAFTVAVASWGDVFIADTTNNRIRKVGVGHVNSPFFGPDFVLSQLPSQVNSVSIISTIAGNGTAAFNGDGWPATAACLFSPQGVAVSSWGEIFIADTKNNRVRKVSGHLPRCY